MVMKNKQKKEEKDKLKLLTIGYVLLIEGYFFIIISVAGALLDLVFPFWLIFFFIGVVSWFIGKRLIKRNS